MESVTQCEFCGKVLSNLWNLQRHINTSKSCLKIRDKSPPNIRSCENCGYKTSLVANLSRHLETCKLSKGRINSDESKEKRRLEDYIIKLETENSMMQKQLDRLPQNIVNNQMNNFNITFNLQLEHSRQILSPYSALEREQADILRKCISQSVCEKGLKGFAQVLISKLLAHEGKKWMISYEPNKTAFHTKNDEKEIQIDDRAEIFFESIAPIMKDIIMKHTTSLITEAVSRSDSDKAFRIKTDLLSMLDKGTPERKRIVKMLANGTCISKASLLSIKLKDQEDVKAGKAKLEFCDTLPDDAVPVSNDWFHLNDPEYLAIKNGVNFKTRARMLGLKE